MQQSVVWSAQEGSFKALELHKAVSASVHMYLYFLWKGNVLAVRVCQFTGFHSHLAQHCWTVCEVFKVPQNISVTWHLTILNVGVPQRLQSGLRYTFDSG